MLKAILDLEAACNGIVWSLEALQRAQEHSPSLRLVLDSRIRMLSTQKRNLIALIELLKERGTV